MRVRACAWVCVLEAFFTPPRNESLSVSEVIDFSLFRFPTHSVHSTPSQRVVAHCLMRLALLLFTGRSALLGIITRPLNGE